MYKGLDVRRMIENRSIEECFFFSSRVLASAAVLWGYEALLYRLSARLRGLILEGEAPDFLCIEKYRVEYYVEPRFHSYFLPTGAVSGFHGFS